LRGGSRTAPGWALPTIITKLRVKRIIAAVGWAPPTSARLLAICLLLVPIGVGVGIGIGIDSDSDSDSDPDHDYNPYPDRDAFVLY
jgi:hypothetical protein